VSLRGRLALAGGAVVLAALVLASLALYPVLSARLSEQHDSALVLAAGQAPDMAKAFVVESTVEGTEGTDGTKGAGKGADPGNGGKGKSGGTPDGKDPEGSGKRAIPDKPFQVGSVLVQFVLAPVDAGPTTGFAPLTDRDVQVAVGALDPYFHDAEYDGTPYRVYTTRLDGASGALVRTAVPMSVVRSTLHRLVLLLAGVTAGGAVLTALATRLAAARVLRPVRRLTDTVEHVTATQDLGARLTVPGRDEIARLTRSFAAMMAALEESVGAQRRLVADASHELRTPLTSLTTNLELLAEGPGLADPQAPALVGEARAQAAELTSLVNDLVDLGRYGAVRAHTEDTRLDLLARRVVDRAAARTSRLDFAADLAPCMVHADPDAVERAIANLVDNAVKWSPDGARVTVGTAADGTLTVTDEGPGIPAADLPFVFDRFYRSPTARALPGSGLGLSIVRQIAETHGGTVTAEILPAGTRMRMRLPPVRG
jgi:two-component system sensor histidine kinase MprB